AGTALSPRRFDLATTRPSTFASASIGVGVAPSGVAIAPDGRRAWVANSASASVSMLDAANGVVLVTTPLAPAVTADAVAMSPDGRAIYVSAGLDGVKVLHPGVNAIVDTIPVAAGDGSRPNPQGLAVSPDGTTLYVADDRDGGAVRVVDLATRSVIATVTRAGAIPLAVAASPDGRKGYFAFAGATDQLVFFDRETLDAGFSMSTCARPTGVAVTPDGARVYVSCEVANEVAVFGADGTPFPVVGVGAGPRGIAITPDGAQLWVANGGSSTVSVLSTVFDQVVTTIDLPAGTAPTAIAISPDGSRAYVTGAGANAVQELGGPLTLTVEKLGSGIGTVTSVPEGIACGLSCQARFPLLTDVTLSAMPDGGSTFDGWGGDCSGPVFAMSANRRCTATFTRVPGTGGGGGGSSGGNAGYDYGYGYGSWSYCFIATAAYGSPMAPEVQVMRDFRDRHLLTNGPGRAFVAFYYLHSPPIAAWLREHEGARTLVRWALEPVVFTVSHPLRALALVLLLPIAWAAFRARRRLRPLVTAAALVLGASAGGCGHDDPAPQPRDTISPTSTCYPHGGTYAAAQYVTLGADERATIFYELEGTALPAGFPTSGAGPNPVYWIRIGPGTTTIRFFAIDSAGNREATKTETFVVEVPP
ncbi:MAG: CFI-box-CTERM domain-containing protein, partial [Anaeromyxobacteraceae bacterium]